MNKIKNTFIPGIMTSLLIILGIIGWAQPAQAQGNPDEAQKMKMLQEMAPYKGYLKAHMNIPPQELLGGPLEVEITQKSGGVFVILPSKRKLDPYVFGTPQVPRALAGTPGINGLPPGVRGINNGQYTEMEKPSPFGDKNIVMGNGKLDIKAVDATATDAGKTNDEIKFMASWQDKQGNTYEVRCCGMLAAHGVEYPTFGGVVTNTVMHGSSRIGTALMPTMYTYFAFWGMGEIRKNGDVLDKPRLVHGMLTEYVRKKDYELAFDDEVTPTRKHFHLMVPPMRPEMKEQKFVHEDVKTGFKLPNGMELPFWHVMFENLEIDADRR
ncbi:hypothetical protein [Fodinibius salsisoli]|uniref:Uncharacterized protein n=1 Tax=Fodinibius salsisoli TaxID=2820877 RepID=A0ABT3PSE5_9BACT|nr:hypothetical protein [Fodinibius salsisoli]MCW9708773.1 hypothetical protein [Fodinibius salsisoli]